MKMVRHVPLVLFLLIQLSAVPLRAQLAYVETDIPVRDGKVLKADVYVNEGSGAKPVILVQTPYSKAPYRLTFALYRETTFPLDSAKYHYVVVDWRGFHASKDAAVAGYDRGLDGYDIVEWIAVQPWCNGKVATYGGSALGMIQFQTARHHPPHLVCAAPMIIDYRTEYSDYYYGGVLRREHVETLERLGFTSVALITSQPRENLYWSLIAARSDYPEEIAVPLLMVSGWFDHYPSDVLRAFRDLRERSPESVRTQHRLIMGPWLHSTVDEEQQGELRFPNAVNVARDAAFAFFDYYLNGAKNGWPLTPPVRYYQMGENEWRDCESWFALAVGVRDFYFGDGGTLLPEQEDDGNEADLFSADPRDPSPSHGAARFNPFDPSVVPGPLDISGVVESRDDVVLHTSAPLARDLAVNGRVSARLYIQSDRPDCDISLRLCDVHPDGRSIILTDGIARMRFREGTSGEIFMQPDSIYSITVGLQEIAHTFLAGHRVRLVVGGADYPRFDINLNNGGALYETGDTLVASVRVYHTRAYPSLLTLHTGSTTGIGAVAPESTTLRMSPPWPQPFSGGTLHLRIDAPARRSVRVELLDLLGRRLRVLHDGPVSTGMQLGWDGHDAAGRPLPTGVYVLALTSAVGSRARLLQILR